MKSYRMLAALLIAVPSLATAQQYPATDQTETSSEPTASDRMTQAGREFLGSLFERLTRVKRKAAKSTVSDPALGDITDETNPAVDNADPTPSSSVGTLMTEEPIAGGETGVDANEAQTTGNLPKIVPLKRPIVVRGAK